MFEMKNKKSVGTLTEPIPSMCFHHSLQQLTKSVIAYTWTTLICRQEGDYNWPHETNISIFLPCLSQAITITRLHCYCSYYLRTFSQQSTSMFFCCWHGMIMLSLDCTVIDQPPCLCLTSCTYLMNSVILHCLHLLYGQYISYKWGDIMLPALFS
jgi:hypothetical protein